MQEASSRPISAGQSCSIQKYREIGLGEASDNYNVSMIPSLLAIDIGNTRVKLGVFPNAAECIAKAQHGVLPVAAPVLPQPAEVASFDPAAADFRARGADAILFASSSAVQSFVDQAAALKLGSEAVKPLAGSIGPQTGATMKQLGVPVGFSAKTPSLDSLVEALVKKLGK